MDIAVIGAGGSVGRQIAQMIVSERLMDKDERLLLIGNPEGTSARSVFGFAVDLTDAYAEISPRIDVTLSPEAIRTDLIVMAIFAKHLGRKRVIGMGAFLDSLRFRKEIAHDLGIRRQEIHGFMLGEHGFNMVPIWSSIHVYGYKEEKLNDALKKVRKGYETQNFPNDVIQASKILKGLITEGKVHEAYRLVDEYPPDIRVALKPFVTHFSGSKTVAATAKATMELLRTMTMGNDAFISGQLNIEGEFHGIHSTVGVPFVIGNQGVEQIVEISLRDEEKELLVRSARNVKEKIDEFVRRG